MAYLLRNTSQPTGGYTLSSNSLNFGSQRVSTTSNPELLRITNTSSANVDLDRFELQGPPQQDFRARQTGCLAQPLPPGQFCTVEVTFTPQAAGDRQGTLLIYDRKGGNQTVALRGRGETTEQPSSPPPVPSPTPERPTVLSFSPGSLTFREQVAGTESAPAAITVTNSGSVPITITQVSLTGEQAGDFQLDDRCTRLVLSRGDTCTLEVLYVPRNAGNSRAVVVVQGQGRGNDNLSSWRIPLSGTSNAPAPTPSRISVSPNRLDFGSLPLRMVSDAQTVTVSNAGTVALELGNLGITGDRADFRLVDNGCNGNTLSVDERCRVRIQFIPSIEGDRTARLTIPNSSPNGNTVVLLTGEGQVQTAPPQIRFFRASTTSIQSGQSVDLCYGVDRADRVVISNVGQVTPSPNSCVVVQPTQNTTYILTASGPGGDERSQPIRVRVQAAEAPGAPRNLFPGSTGEQDAPNICLDKPLGTSRQRLEWEPGSGGAANRYEVTLQASEDGNWVDRTVQLTEQPFLDVSITDFSMRWRVRARSTSGEWSEPALWRYFICAQPR